MALDWAHTPQTNKQYYQTGSEVESAREAQTGTTKEHVAQRNGGRLQANRTNWRREPRTEVPGEHLLAAYAPLGAIGVSK